MAIAEVFRTGIEGPGAVDSDTASIIVAKNIDRFLGKTGNRLGAPLFEWDGFGGQVFDRSSERTQAFTISKEEFESLAMRIRIKYRLDDKRSRATIRTEVPGSYTEYRNYFTDYKDLGNKDLVIKRIQEVKGGIVSSEKWATGDVFGPTLVKSTPSPRRLH